MKDIKDNESICSECDKKINDNVETKWDLNAEPYCKKCYTDEMKNEVTEYYIDIKDTEEFLNYEVNKGVVK